MKKRKVDCTVRESAGFSHLYITGSYSTLEWELSVKQQLVNAAKENLDAIDLMVFSVDVFTIGTMMSTLRKEKKSIFFVPALFATFDSTVRKTMYIQFHKL